MRIDLHCPVEHLKTEFTRDDRGNVRAYLTLNNLSNHTVERLDAVAVFEDASGARAEVPFSMESLNVMPRSTFSAMASTRDLPGATNAHVQFSRVIFDGDQPVWMFNAARLIDVPDLPRPDGRELNRLRAAAGDGAVVFPIRTGQLWMCVCSRANPYRRKTCLRCGRERDHVLNAYDMARLLSKRAPGCRRASDAPAEPAVMPLFGPKQAPPDSGDSRRRFLRARTLIIRRTLFFLAIVALLLLCAELTRTRPRPDAIPPVKIDSSATRSHVRGGAS